MQNIYIYIYIMRVYDIVFSRLQLVKIRGKRGRTVAAILTAEVQSAMEVLVSRRDEVMEKGVNDYFFATTSSNTHIRGSDVMRKLSQSCQPTLKRPETMRSTKLRRSVATMSQLADLNDTEVDWLARHLGHDIRVHREYYRLQTSTITLSKVSKMLMAVDSGVQNRWTRINLSQIDEEGIYIYIYILLIGGFLSCYFY